jgi:phage-related minor tail protein
MAADLEVSIGVDVDGLNNGLNSASKKFEEFGKKMTSIGSAMSLAITTPLLLIGKQMIKLASDSQEATNKVEVAFGKSADAVKEFASTSLTQFGIAKGSAMDMASTYGDMSTSMGLTQEQAASLSTSLVGLAADLASFKNIGIEQP